MAARIEAESTLTDRYQTTIPEIVRRALKLGKRDKIQYTVRPGGEVILSRAASLEEADDPVLGEFLRFLAGDLVRHPERVRPLDARLATRLEALVGDVEVDLEAELPDEDA